eukprot:1206336-Pyramimonas_sp.AAC.1
MSVVLALANMALALACSSAFRLPSGCICAMRPSATTACPRWALLLMNCAPSSLPAASVRRMAL